MKLNILHIAPMNTSGVPGQLVQAERCLGHNSRLVTLYRDRRRYFEDICLDLPFIDFSATAWIKKRVSAPEKLFVDNKVRIPEAIPLAWRPNSAAENALVRLRDLLWKPRIEKAIREHRLDRFDVYQLDGGLDFYRFPRFIPRVKNERNKLICCYTGSDLRTRGVIPGIDRLSDLNVTVEFDHLKLHPHIHHVFFPFDAARLPAMSMRRSGRTRIGHAPTNWQAKGSDVIVPCLLRLEKEQGIEMVLIENVPYERALELKGSCDIFVDQIGDLGYGINSLEALAMGIPCCSCLAPGFSALYPDHPFIEVDAGNLYQELARLIKKPALRRQKGRYGRKWVLQMHDSRAVVRKIHHLAGLD